MFTDFYILVGAVGQVVPEKHPHLARVMIRNMLKSL
jgi:hypothetical protein